MRERRVWPILIIFLVVIALIIGGVITLLRRDAATSLATTFISQPLSDDARASLQVSPLAPEDYLIGGNLDIAGALGVNTITSSADMLIGSQEHAVALQGSNVSLSATIGGATNTLRFATPSGASNTIVVPNASGTIAVSASGPLVLDANGNLSCPSCVSPVTTASAASPIPTVTPGETASLNAISGDVLLQGTGNQIVVTNVAGSKTITLSLPQDINTSASPVFANINITQSLQVADIITAGSLTLTAPLAVSSGGTGVSSIATNSVVLGNGSDALTSITGNNGQCLVISGSVPTFGACPGADGVTSINGQNGALTINASSPSSILMTGTTITIQDASATVKGLASFNTANLTVTGGVVNTIQDIAVTSTPTFAGLNLTSALALASGGTNATTAGGARTNLGAAASGANTDITSLSGLTSALSVLQGGTGATTYADGQLLLGDSSNGGLKVATLTAGSGVTITNGNGAITVSAPTAGTCPGCANTSLSNLSGVAINTSLLPGTNNTLDVGSATAAFRNGYYGTSVHSSSFDTVSASLLNIGTSTATGIALGADTNIAAGKSLTVNGAALFKNAVNSTTAFQLQDSSGVALLNANTTQSTLSVGVYVPTVVWSTAPVTRTDYVSGANTQSVAKADFNGDGKPDLAVTNINSNTVSVFMNTGTGTFAAKVDYATGVNPRGVISADFNGDGKPDLVVANWGADTISVFMNTGTGTFAAKVDYATSSKPQNPTSADFNGDGKPDIAVAYQNANVVSVFINNGNGTFAAKVDYATGGAGVVSWAVTATDFNGDGKADLAVTNSTSNTVSVFINNGNGTFAAKVDYVTGTAAYGVGAADFNGDGKPDLAITNVNANTVSVFINNGNGTFAAKVDYVTGSGPQAVTAADLNGDGKADFAVANSTSNTVSVFAGNGNGTFAAKVDYTTGTGPSAITSADFNNDSVVDLATANNSGSNVSVLVFGVTTGTPVAQVASKLVVNASTNTVGQIIQGSAGQTADLLQVRDDLNTTLFSVGATGNVIAAGTLSVTGAATASSTLNVVGTFTSTGAALFKNTTNSTTAFQIQQASGAAVFGVDTTNGRIGIGTAAPANKLSVNAITTADATAQVAVGTSAAGNKGLVLQGVVSQTANLIEAQNSTGAVLASIGATGATLFKNSVDSSAALQIQNSSGLAFLNADTTNSTISIGSSDRYTPAAKVDYATGSTPYEVTSADFNGDGKADLAVANNGSNTVSVFMNTGTGTFAAKVDYTTGGTPLSVTSADFNSDGKPDLAVANSGSNTVSVFMNTGTGTFAAKVDYTTGGAPHGVTSADVNGDSKADLIVANTNSNSVSVFMNNGDGTFAARVNYTTGVSPFSVTSADVNSDGKPDLIVANTNSNSVSVFMNNGNGTFAAKVDYAIALGSGPASVTAADFNSDGKPDLAVANSGSNTVSVFMNTGTGTFAAKVDYATGTFPRSVTSADLNGDGRPDLAIAGNGGFVSILINNGDGTFMAKVDYVTGINSMSVTAADFNGDGKPDLAVTNTTTNAVSVFMNTTILSTSAKLTIKASVASVGQVIQSASGQTADLLQVKDSANGTLYSVGATGNVLFKNNTNSTSAFQVQQASGTAVFGVDTTNGRVGIGTIAPANKLSVNNLTTADAFAQLAIGTGAVTNKGLIVQGVLNQTADLLQAQSSTGAVLARISATGTLTVTSAVVNGTLTVNGHIITSGTVPTIAADIAACAIPTVSVAGNDTSGTITITSGTGCASIGSMATITFNGAFGAAPRIIMTPNNANASNLKWYNGTATTTTFTVDTATIPTDATTYTFNYWAVQ